MERKNEKVIDRSESEKVVVEKSESEVIENKGGSRINDTVDDFKKEVFRLMMMMERLEIEKFREIFITMNKKVGNDEEKMNLSGNQVFLKACIIYKALPEEGKGGLRREFFLKYFALKGEEDKSGRARKGVANFPSLENINDQARDSSIVQLNKLKACLELKNLLIGLEPAHR